MLNFRRTEQLIKNAEHAGVSHVAIHGRTKDQPSSDDVNLNKIKLAASFASIPTVANGDANSLDSSNFIRDFTGCDGIMSARGLINNPVSWIFLT